MFLADMSTRILGASNRGGPIVHQPRSARWPTLLAAIALACLVWAVFHPMLGFELVDLDVPDQITDNPYVQGLTWENVRHIFTSLCVNSYYPVRALSYAVDYQFWGLNPTGFKLTNGLFHLTNVLLLFWLVRRLLRGLLSGGASANPWWDVSVAAFSAAVFAVHPVVVEPVAWVPGREELLMTLGALACLHLHLTARRLSEEGGKTRSVAACYAGSAFFCAAACLSNVVAAVIPLLIVAWELLGATRRRWSGILYGTSALWPISAVAVWIKKTGFVGDISVLADNTLGQRLMLVVRTYWLNVKTLVYPRNLAVSYEWFEPESFFELDVVYGFLAVGLTCLVLWKIRRRRMILLGLAWFGLALGPSLQIMPHHVYRSDRFLYLPLVGLVVAGAMALRPLEAAMKRPRKILGASAAALLILIGLSILSGRQLQTWRNSVSVWEQCLSVGPDCDFGHQCFAHTLASAGRFDEAIFHYQVSLLIDSDDAMVFNDYASRLATWPDERLRDYDQAIRLAIRGCELTEWLDPELRRTLAVAHMNFATALRRDGQFEKAIENYRKAIAADRAYEVPYFNLALLLATCSEPDLRRPDEAVQMAEWACRLTQPPSPVQFSILADVYAHTGRFDEAVAAAEKAIQLARADGDPLMADELQNRLKLHRNRIPPQLPY